VRRFFPFLGRWYEKEANLIFLSDAAAGFPVPESFRVRIKQNRLVSLYGNPLPFGLATGPVTNSEVLVELDTLIRLSVTTDERNAGRLVFWKRIFTKLIALVELLGLSELAAEFRGRPELDFLDNDDIHLFLRAGKPEAMFSLLLVLAQQLCATVRSREPLVKIEPVAWTPPETQSVTGEQTASKLSPMSLGLNGSIPVSAKTISWTPMGLVPRLLYFPIDDRIPLLEFHKSSYRGLHRLRHAMAKKPLTDDNALVAAEGFMFIVTRQPSFVDLVPLDPIIYANVYAAYQGATAFEMPASVFAEQEAASNGVSSGLANTYRSSDGQVTKLPYPCIYRENDIEVIEHALRIIRARIATSGDLVLVRQLSDLFGYLRQRNPEARDFVTALEQQRRYLFDESAMPPAANNWYHCLHQYMWQLLSGAPRITLDPLRKHLAITVGVITRNRAGDLGEMLESLACQRRAPDEVLVVDNGSTDRTQAVIERFRSRLPIRSHFLAEASIPAARNLVIERAAHDIVSFIDDDCISEPQWLEAVEAGFLRATNVGVVGGWVRHEPAPRPSSVDNYYRIFHHNKS
jgi:Glycosyl transferase family 2